MILFKFLFLTFISIPQIYCADPLVTVNTPRGTVVGYHFDQGNDTSQTWYGQADIFLGIPFAIPPVGQFRYKQPRPITQFPGPSPYNATYYRALCIQPYQPINTSSEDCLYVNIWTPNASSTKKYPVMLYIHGGGLEVGSGRLGQEQIVRNLVSKGVVVASLEYRLSWLGFFTTFTDDFPPNIGMLDQVLALKFLKEELPYFGGDPNQITIFGESAGGHSISSHTFSPLSQNLFQQAIMESGTFLTCYEDSVGPTNQSYHFAKYACGYTDEMWNSKNFTALKECLMKIDVQDGINFEGQAYRNTSNHVCWNMVQDNYFFPGNPQALANKRPNIPVIIGTCKDEYASWEMGKVKSDHNLTSYTRQQVEQRLTNTYAVYFGNNSQRVINIFESNYLPNGTADDDHVAWLQFVVDVGTPAYFIRGSLLHIQYYLNNNNPNVYTYEFVWPSALNDNGNPIPDWHPVLHVCEMPYLYNYNGAWSSTDKAIANLVQESWANFAKYGKPSLDGSWKPTTSKDPTKLEYFQFSNVSTAKTGYRAKDQVVWNEQLPQILGDSPPYLADNYPVCTRGYTSKIKNTTCYEAFATSVPWGVAQATCGTNSYGTLVTVGSAFENSDLLAYAKSASPSCSSFYIGLFKSQYVLNSWNWANYDLSTYRNWKSGYPISDPNAGCVALNANDGTWINQACDTVSCYICSY